MKENTIKTLIEKDFRQFLLWAPVSSDTSTAWTSNLCASEISTQLDYGHGTVSVYHLISHLRNHCHPEMPLNILSLNAKGLNYPAKRHSLWRTAEKLQSDIICVQQTHLLSQSTSLCSNRKFPTIYHSTFTSKKRGVLIAIKHNIDFRLTQEISDPQGRFLILLCTINNVKYTLLNIYAPNTQQMSFIRKTVRKAQENKQGHLLLCGDFNLVIDIHMDTTSAAKRRDSPLKQFLTSQDLFDVWRCHQGSEKDYTYFSSHHKSYSRIDMFIVDKWLLQKISASVIHTMSWSDHAPITISISDTAHQRNTFLWRANNYVLQHPTYSQEISEHLKKYFELNNGSVGDPAMVWNAHKAVIRGIILKLSHFCKKKRGRSVLTTWLFKLPRLKPYTNLTHVHKHWPNCCH